MSARKGLRQQLEAARRANYLDLRAVAFDGVFVRCRALGSDELTTAMKRTDDTEQAIDLLSTACIGVWQEDEGKGISPVDGFSGVIDLETGHLSGELPTFASNELAAELGAEGGAGATIRALLAPKSDLALGRLATELLEWSGDANEKVVREARPS